MKMTLEKLRKMNESELPDSDHPFKEDITAEEFAQIIEESAKETIKVKPLSPINDQEWEERKQEMLDALNRAKNPC